MYKYKIFTKIVLLHNLYGTRTSYIWLYHIILICEPSLTLVIGITKLQCAIIYLFILLLISFRAILVEATMKWRLQHESHQEIYSTIFKALNTYCIVNMLPIYLTIALYYRTGFKHHQEYKSFKFASKPQMKFHCNQILICNNVKLLTIELYISKECLNLLAVVTCEKLKILH
jgi:hypothetical protein